MEAERAIGPIAKGAFHRWLGKKEDEPITQADIAKGLASDDPHVKKMAQFAKNAKKFNNGEVFVEGLPDGVYVNGYQVAGLGTVTDERQHDEPDADEFGGAPDNDADDQGECPTCGGLGSVNGESCPNVEAHLTTESVGGQQQLAATPELELRRRERLEELDGTKYEYRDFAADVEVRTTSDGKLELTGYASTTETPYEVMGFTETIARGAFKRTLADKPDVVLLINHEGLPLARTKSGTLTLTEDVRGLRVDAVLEPSDPDVQALRPKMERKDLTEMSFAFRPTLQDWDENKENRLIREVSIHRGDVSMVTHGANSATSASLAQRSADSPSEATEVASKPLRRSHEVEWAKARRAKLRRGR